MTTNALKNQDPTVVFLMEEIAAARKALVELCKEDPGRSWRAYDLKTQARNGWSAGAMSLALGDLLDDGVFRADGDCISLSG